MADLETLRHSTSHIMARAVKELFPGVKLGIGPAIAEGFYYDFLFTKPPSADDLPKIEAKMRELIAKDEAFIRKEVGKDEARKILQQDGETFKLELLEELPEGEKITFYAQGDFNDLCRGPHVTKAGEIKVFKLLSLAGAYWRGSEKNQMLTRIYGTAFLTQKELDDHVFKLEEAVRRDHRTLGRQLELFNFFEEAGPGLVYYYPKGAVLRRTLENFLWDEHIRRGYQPVMIPHIAKVQLWQTSGHADYYRENMFFLEVEEQEYVLKPMNCPGHILIFNSKIRSYRDLPLRFFEFGTVYRFEKSGVLHGLLRVRGFTQDDAHLFCRPDQLAGEVAGVLDFIKFTLATFGFEAEYFLSTRPEKFAGTSEGWDRAEGILAQAMKDKGISFTEEKGGGVFYGPKIDVKLKDAIGRLWQGPTVQVDFVLPERFDLHYIGEDGQKHRPVMVHRVVLGSLERFFGALIENYAGAFPLWLAPVQVIVLPIADRHIDYCKNIKEELQMKGFRVGEDFRPEKIGYRIREAQLMKIPYMLVAGDKEVAENKIAVRSRDKGDLGQKVMSDLLSLLDEEIKAKK